MTLQEFLTQYSRELLDRFGSSPLRGLDEWRNLIVRSNEFYALAVEAGVIF